MAANVEFQDFSFEVKEALNSTSIGWLRTTAEEIKSLAQRTTSTSGWTSDERTQLRDSYRAIIDEAKGEAQVGSSMEAAYWEEWGTGEYAAHGDGRKGWWIYIPGQESMGGGQTYYDEMEAMMMAAFIQQKYGKKAYVTNGRRPNYTLENAFGATKNQSIRRLEQLMKERMGT